MAKKEEVAQEICEGRAKILFPDENEVFYNPVQEFNRDLRWVYASRVIITLRNVHDEVANIRPSKLHL